MEKLRWLSKEIGRRKLLAGTIGSVVALGLGGRIYDELDKPSEVEFDSLLNNPTQYVNDFIRVRGYQGKTTLSYEQASIDFVTQAVSIREFFIIHKEADEQSPGLEARRFLGIFHIGDPKIKEITGKDVVDLHIPDINRDASLDNIQIDGIFKEGGFRPDNVFYYIDSEQKGGFKKLAPPNS